MVMGRPVDTWYIFPIDIEKYTELSERQIRAYVQHGTLVPDDILSLLVFTATHIEIKWRQALQHDLARNQMVNSSLPKHKPTEPTRDRVEFDGSARWEIHTKAMMRDLGVSMNIIHIAKHDGVLDPGWLLSLLRFALFRARPAQRAEIIAGLFSAPVPVPLPAPRTKTDERMSAKQKKSG